jgi:hypothetical protein
VENLVQARISVIVDADLDRCRRNPPPIAVVEQTFSDQDLFTPRSVSALQVTNEDATVLDFDAVARI